MDTVEVVKAKIEAKTKELEDLKKKIPRKCGEAVPNIPVKVWLKIEELEEEIEKLKQEIQDV
jgi:polyhydroxyalkanoate synthesis regulator phasin